MAKNPPWMRDEVVLALALYFEGGRKQLAASDPRVVELSHLLNSLPLHREEDRVSGFRSPSSVSMKLGNFSSVDPEYPGVELYQAAKLDKRIWDEFSEDLERLVGVARAIGSTYRETSEVAILADVDAGDKEFLEGRILTRIHKQRERNHRLVLRKKEKVLAETERLACEVCAFDFEAFYGELGRGFAECHHLTPLAQLRAGQKTTLADLAIVCANCHRMLHRNVRLLKVEQLQASIRFRATVGRK